MQALLALGDGEQQRRQWDEREDRLSEAGVDADERVVGEGERAPEQQRAEDQRSDESPPSRRRETHRRHHGGQQ